MNKRIIGVIGFLAIVLLAVYISLQIARNSSEEQIETVNIGVLLPLTGNAAYYGEASRRGIEIAKEEIEQSYPNINFKVFYEDSLYTAQGGVSAYKKLRNIQKTDAVITAASQVSLAILPLATEDKVVQMAIFSSTNKYSVPNDLSFRVSTKNDIESQYVAKFVKKQAFKTLAIVYLNNDFGVGFKDALKEQLSQLKTDTTIIAEESYLLEDNDFRTSLAKIKNKSPDAVFIVGTATSYALILKQARELGMKTQFISMRSAEDPVLLRNAKEAAESLVYTYPFDQTKQNKEIKTFTKKFQTKYATIPDAYAAEGYEGFKLLAQAYNKCGKEEPCLKSYFQEIKEYNSLFGLLTFDLNGDVVYPFFLKTVRNGEFVPLES